VLGRGRWQQVVVMCEQYKEQEGIGQIDRYSLGGRLRYRHFSLLEIIIGLTGQPTSLRTVLW
jgi:hypothetical protein